MDIRVDQHIFSAFPQVIIGVIIAEDFVYPTDTSDILQLLRTQEAKQHEVLQNTDIGTLPEVMAWRKIYKQFGSDPHDYRSSVEALLKRAKNGSKPLPQIHPLVDLYNYISLKYHVPCGAEDLNTIKGDLVLRFALGTESGRVLGEDKESVCEKGEVVYVDDDGFVCRRWNWRESDRTKITISTTRAVVVIEKVSEVPNDQFTLAMGEMEGLLEEKLHARCRSITLSFDLLSVAV